MRTRAPLAAAALLAAGVLPGAMAAPAAAAPLTQDQAAKLAEDAYIFGYPLLMMDVRTTEAIPAVPSLAVTVARISTIL